MAGGLTTLALIPFGKSPFVMLNLFQQPFLTTNRCAR